MYRHAVSGSSTTPAVLPIVPKMHNGMPAESQLWSEDASDTEKLGIPDISAVSSLVDNFAFCFCRR